MKESIRQVTVTDVHDCPVLCHPRIVLFRTVGIEMNFLSRFLLCEEPYSTAQGNEADWLQTI